MKRQQRQQPVSGEYYATLPLKGMENSKVSCQLVSGLLEVRRRLLFIISDTLLSYSLDSGLALSFQFQRALNLSLSFPCLASPNKKERAKQQRNLEYQIVQTKIETSEKHNQIEWWKDKNEPDIKPYSVSISFRPRVAVFLSVWFWQMFVPRLDHLRLLDSPF